MQWGKKVLDSGKNWVFYSVLNNIQNDVSWMLWVMWLMSRSMNYTTVLKHCQKVFLLSKDIGDTQWCQKGISKEDLWAVPPRNCQQTVIPSEKRGDAEETVESVCLPSYLRFSCEGNYRLMWHCVYSDSSLSSFLMPSREGLTPDLWRGPITILYSFFVCFFFLL